MLGMLGLLFGKKGLPIVELAKVVAGALDNLHTSDGERLDKAAVQAKLEAALVNKQLEVNLAEAKHRSIFVAGWRPAIGWICGIALFLQYIVHPFAVWGFAMWQPNIFPPSVADIAPLNVILMGMLGVWWSANLREDARSNSITLKQIEKKQRALEPHCFLILGSFSHWPCLGPFV